MADNKISAEGDNFCNIFAATFPIRPLHVMPSDPVLWLTHLDLQFKCAKITNQIQKYDSLAAALPSFLVSEVRDIIMDPPEDKPYDTLRAAIIARTAVSQEKRIKQLLGDLSLGDQTQSQLLRRMRQLVGDMTMDDVLLRQLWMQHLPDHMKATLSIFSDKSTLEELATAADCMVEHAVPSINKVNPSLPSPCSEAPTIAQLAKQLQEVQLDLKSIKSHYRYHPRSRSRSTRRNPSQYRRCRRSPTPASKGWCWFHTQYREKARNCKSGRRLHFPQRFLE